MGSEQYRNKDCESVQLLDRFVMMGNRDISHIGRVGKYRIKLLKPKEAFRMVSSMY